MLEKIATVLILVAALVYYIESFRCFACKGQLYVSKHKIESLTDEQKKVWYKRTAVLNLLIATEFLLLGLHNLLEKDVILIICAVVVVVMFAYVIRLYLKSLSIK